MGKRHCCCLILILFCSAAFGHDALATTVLQAGEGSGPLLEVSAQAAPGIVPNQGFSLSGLWRGILGMAAMVLIAYVFSANRKAIQWRKVGIGLALQLLIAIGVLKIPFVQFVFEQIGQVFVKILDYTRAGSQFLFEGLVVDMETFGYIFALQVLPT